MVRKRKILLILVMCIMVSFLYSNEAKIDSLINQLDNVPEQDRVHILNELGKMYWGISSEKTLEYSKQALELSRKLTYRKGEAQSLNNIGVGYYFLGDYDKALEYFLNSLKIREELGDKKEIVASLNNIGIIFDDFNDFEQALYYYKRSLEIFEELKDVYGIATTLHNIGVVYESLSNYNKSLEYLLRALKIYEEINDRIGIASTLGNIGIVFKDLSNYDKSLEYHLKSLKISEEINDKNGIANSLDNIGIIYENLNNYDKAIEYYLKSMEIEEEIGDDVGVASSLNNIGIIYDNQGQYDKALEYYIQSLEINEKIGFKNGIANSMNNIGVVYENLEDFDKSLEYHDLALKAFKEIGNRKGYAASLNNIASVYLMLKKYDKALEYFRNSLEVAEKIGTKDLIIEIYEKISRLYSEKKNYREALKYYKLYTAIKDSIFTKEKIEKIAGMQTTYEVEHLLEQQEIEIELLTKDNEIYKLFVEKQKLVNWRLYSGLIILFTFIFVIYYRYRLKYKANKLLKQLVEERTEDLTRTNKNLKKEIAERKKIESQLIRSERLAGLGELAAGIAHEIRNPLGNISSSAQFCLSKFPFDKEMKKYFEIILEDSEKANTIIKGLLDFANPREITLKKGNICKVVDNVISSVNARCLENSVEIVKKCKDDFQVVLFDEKWLEQAFLNFVLNAIQAMPEGGTLNITELYAREKNEFKIILSDTGTGITKANLKKIFDPFFTTREHGVGLGLSLAHKIIEDHKGRVHITSQVKKGTVVTITFPIDTEKQK
ncbi:MAG: tetratricopeptide repeat protein [Candidatus Cloacimonetes bacterium]|nr:tetratricopeptide repeat protein [Candidatus Cloacimonadota bacterium]